MLPCSDLPKGYEPGRFHLLPLGIFVELIGMPAFIFTGRIYHGGTAPLAPDGTEDIEPWAYRFVMIFYPASRIITDSTQTYMAASGIRGRGITLPYETFGPKYGHRLLSFCLLTQHIYIYSPPRPTSTHATYYTDGGIISTPQDHFTNCMRMHSLLSHHLFRQLPYEVRWNSEAIYNSVEVQVDGKWIKAEPWAHHPANLINCPDNEDEEEPADFILEKDNIRYPPSAHYPSRQSIMTQFANLFVKHGALTRRRFQRYIQ